MCYFELIRSIFQIFFIVIVYDRNRNSHSCGLWLVIESTLKVFYEYGIGRRKMLKAVICNMYGVIGICTYGELRFYVGTYFISNNYLLHVFVCTTYVRFLYTYM